MTATLAPPTYDCRKAFAETLIELARADERIVAVCNDSVGSSNLGGFRDEFPDRLINVGIAEQDLVGVGAGLANGGLIPFVSAAAPFLTGRALEQIKADVAYSGTHVILCGQSPGMAYGELGPTHHSIEDLSWMRAIDEPLGARPRRPGADPRRRPLRGREPRAAVPARAALQGPRGDARGRACSRPAVRCRPRRRRRHRDRRRHDGQPRAGGRRGAAAPTVSSCACSTCRSSTRSTRAAVLAAARGTRGIVTAEEAITTGGLGAAVASLVAQHHPVPMRILGVDGFAPTGSTEFLLDHFGLTAGGIAAAAREGVGAMTRADLVLAIDQGTSATKALLVDARRRDRGARHGPVGGDVPRPGWVEQRR